MDPVVLILMGLKAVGEIMDAMKPVQQAADEQRTLSQEEAKQYRDALTTATDRLRNQD